MTLDSCFQPASLTPHPTPLIYIFNLTQNWVTLLPGTLFHDFVFFQSRQISSSVLASFLSYFCRPSGFFFFSGWLGVKHQVSQVTSSSSFSISSSSSSSSSSPIYCRTVTKPAELRRNSISLSRKFGEYPHCHGGLYPPLHVGVGLFWKWPSSVLKLPPPPPPPPPPPQFQYWTWIWIRSLCEPFCVWI